MVLTGVARPLAQAMDVLGFDSSVLWQPLLFLAGPREITETAGGT